MNMRPMNRLPVVVGLLLIVACGGDRTAEQRADTTPAGDTAAGMAGMAMGDTAMMADMQRHMSMMQGISADSMRSMLPMHRQMLGNMLASFDRDMRQMNMTPDASWNALTDSLRQDNTRLADMNASQLGTFMPQHRARVTRMIEMHRTMMANMKM